MLSKHGLDSPLEGPSLGQLGPHGSWGFSPVGGNRLYSEGELVLVLSIKGKEDCPELPTVLAVILKENYLLDPCVVSSNPLWEARLSSSKISTRVNGPQDGRLLCGGAPEIGALDAEGATLPSYGAGSLELNAPEGPPVESEGNKRKKEKGKEKPKK